ncbi:hypothetical protein R3P38DRAFT_3483346 [Favolaschia claudopus]|uniref:Uncharacterized protein n=1 Tax=Favolaschia claudopus TaxID=2862362 RepID=A0AAW0C7U0_9AGAR
MALENDTQEFIELSDTVIGQIFTTMNVSGGTGGQGGGGGQEGGTGGKGQGPTINVSGPVGRIVHLRDRDIDTDGPHKISIYDINFQHELCSLRRRRGNIRVVRRFQTAKVKNQNEIMTVAVYEGENAEEEFKQDVAKYMEFRLNPSFLQLYGIVRSENTYASIFYDALIPWRDTCIFRSHVRNLHSECSMLLCYLYTSLIDDFHAAGAYFEEKFGTELFQGGHTLFLRPFTGRLCIDLGKGTDDLFSLGCGNENFPPTKSLLSGIDIQTIIDALTIEQYHKKCNQILRSWSTASSNGTSFPLTTTVHLGAVYHRTGSRSSDRDTLIAIAPTLDTVTHSDRNGKWLELVRRLHMRKCGSVTLFETSFPISELGDNDLEWARAELRDEYGEERVSNLWLSQANHVLSCRGVHIQHEDADHYALLTSIEWTVGLEPQSARPTDCQHLTNVFLFLCPPESFQVGLGPASFKCPECVGYWSFDPSGVVRLSEDEAFERGFPTLRVSMRGYIDHWFGSVYTGLRQFHQAKGFNPDSQDLARHLGYALYELYSDDHNSMNVDGSAARIEEVSSADIDEPVDQDELGNLEIGEDGQRTSVPKSWHLDEHSGNIVVSSSLKILALIQLSLILLTAVLALYGL